MKDILARLIDMAIQVQQIPAPTFQEGERAKFVRGAFLAEGLGEVEIDPAGNVLACLGKGNGSRKHQTYIIVSAHLDTVFPADTELTLHREGDKIYGAGIGDNSIAVAGLLGLVWLLRDRNITLPCNLVLAANTCEEGLGDLRGMKAIVDRYGEDARAYIVLEGMGLGSIYHRGLGVRRFRITVQTEGGHSWLDYGRPSAIHELSRLSAHLTRLTVPNQPRTTLNIGTIGGGTSVNTIAAEAHLELDLRSENAQALALLVNEVEKACKVAEKEGVSVKLECIGNRPSGGIPPDHPLVSLAAGNLRKQGIEPRLAIGSTDANIPLSRNLPAVTLGLTTGGRAHTVHEFINTSPLEKGMEALLGVVTSLT